MSLSLNKYLKLLRTEASRFERTDINNNVNDSFNSKYTVKIFFGLLSLLTVFFLKQGFSNDFVSFVSSVLSILVGLFITALIFSFDKFYEPSKEEHPSSRIKLWETQAYNYAKKFAYITSYTIVISIFTLVLLSVSALFGEKTRIDFGKLEFCFNCISLHNRLPIKLFVLACFLAVQRFFVLYFLLKVMYNTLFIVSSMVQYMTTKIDRK